MNKTVLIDTNLYLDDANIIYKMSKEYDKILIPVTVMKELDKKKYDRDLSYSARNAIKAIQDFKLAHEGVAFYDPKEYEEFKVPDDKIIASALAYGSAIATKDVAMSIKAEFLGLECNLHNLVLNNIFNPYVHTHMSDIMGIMDEDTFSYNREYVDEEYDGLIEVFSKVAGRILEKDYWWFVIINIDTGNPVIYANHPMLGKIIRIDDDPSYREIRTSGSTIKARDCYQVCAIYALEEAPHTLITGRWGSGKTLLSTAHTLARSRKKAFITRAPLGINRKYDLGFMPGDKSEKMMDWLQGFMSALYYLYANTRSDCDGNGSTYDHVRDSIFPAKFQIMPMNSIQGLSLLDNDTLIVDEAQLITVDYMSMILSRPSKTGRLVLLGDIKQSYDVVKPSESGLLKLLRVLPHKYMAYVELQNSYRSPLLEVADQLQDKSLF